MRCIKQTKFGWIKHEFKASLKENEIKKLLVVVDKRYKERINKIVKYQKLCEKVSKK